VATPFQGQFVARWLGFATIDMHTKFEVSVFTHYIRFYRVKTLLNPVIVGETKENGKKQKKYLIT